MRQLPRRLRARLPYVALAAATIALGLAVHLRGRAVLAPAARDVLGDALWAAMVAWWVAAAAPGLALRASGTLALAVPSGLTLLARALGREGEPDAAVRVLRGGG